MLLVFSFRVGSFGLLCMSFVNVHQFVYVLLSLFLLWDFKYISS